MHAARRQNLVLTLITCGAACLSTALDAASATGAEEPARCASETEGAMKGSAMLQVRQASSPVTAACSVDRAKDVPLTEDGFHEVSKSCCYEDLKVFITRVIDDMGLKVCDEGGLSGIAPFYSCPITPASFAELKDELNKATPKANSKCHWIATRYEECTEPALECAVSAQRPPPAPKPVASGFIAFKVTNPSEMVRSSRAIDVVKNELSLSLGVDSNYVNVVIGSGPLDGDEVLSSFFQVPASQAFFTSQDSSRQCKVFAVYSIQESEPAPAPEPAPGANTKKLNQKDVVDKLKHIDTDALSSRLTQDLDTVDSNIGSVEVMETSTCEENDGKCSHKIIKERASLLSSHIVGMFPQ